MGKAKDKFGDYPFFTSGDAVLRWTEPIVEGRNTFLNTGGNADVTLSKDEYNGSNITVKASRLFFFKLNFMLLLSFSV